MLTIFGRAPSGSPSCDGIHRRDFLTIGGSLAGGLTLADLLRAESGQGVQHGHKALINVYLPGGPPHIDMFDLKPDAPAEIRGEFRPIKTKVPGIEICEHFPRLARMADKLSIIRSLVGFRDDHNTHWCSTGWESHPAMDASPLVPGFPQVIIWWVVLAAIGAFMLAKTRFGNWIFAAGGDAVAAKNVGVPVRRVIPQADPARLPAAVGPAEELNAGVGRDGAGGGPS